MTIRQGNWTRKIGHEYWTTNWKRNFTMKLDSSIELWLFFFVCVCFFFFFFVKLCAFFFNLVFFVCIWFFCFFCFFCFCFYFVLLEF